MTEYSLKLTVADLTIEAEAGSIGSVQELFQFALAKRKEIQQHNH